MHFDFSLDSLTLFLLCVFGLAAVATIVSLVVQARKRKRATPADNVQYWTSLWLLFGELVLALMTWRSNGVAARSVEIAQSSLMEQQAQGDLAREYMEWRSSYSASGDGDITLGLTGLRRSSTHEMQCFVLRIIPLFLHTETKIVDDADVELQPYIELGCDDLEREIEPNLNTGRFSELVKVKSVLTALKNKYSGRPQMEKLTSKKIYQLHSLEVRLTYWHTTKKMPAFSLFTRLAIIGLIGFKLLTSVSGAGG